MEKKKRMWTDNACGVCVLQNSLNAQEMLLQMDKKLYLFDEHIAD